MVDLENNKERHMNTLAQETNDTAAVDCADDTVAEACADLNATQTGDLTDNELDPVSGGKHKKSWEWPTGT